MGSSSLQNTHKQLDFEKIINSNKKTEFIIPKNLGREVTEEKDTLSKYLKDTPTIQSHTIHISELLNSSAKGTNSNISNKSQGLSGPTSIIGHKRVKSHHLINIHAPISDKIFSDKNRMDLISLKSLKKDIFSAQSVSSDLKLSEDSLLKRHDPYKIRMTKNKVFSKKGSIGSTKCTVLKSK